MFNDIDTTEHYGRRVELSNAPLHKKHDNNRTLEH